jgi:ubiquitin-conjugating enzyme E2 variant
MFIVAAAATAEPEVAEATSPASTPADASSSSSAAEVAAAAAAQQARGSSKWVIDEKEVLHSTFEHRAWTYGCMALLAGGMAQAASHVHDLHDAGVVTVALMASYVLSDLGTAVFHWGVDNYGDGSTPVLGKQIAAFQGHHQRPWTITQREFANNVHQVRPGAHSWTILCIRHYIGSSATTPSVI